MYLYSSSSRLCTCTDLHPNNVLVQLFILIMYLYSSSSQVCTCTALHSDYVLVLNTTLHHDYVLVLNTTLHHDYVLVLNTTLHHDYVLVYTIIYTSLKLIHNMRLPFNIVPLNQVLSLLFTIRVGFSQINLYMYIYIVYSLFYNE